MGKALSALAAVFLLAHLPFLPQTLDDIDAINFALGVRDFDVAQHQPHPPGYPVYIAMSKVSTAVVSAMGIAGPEARGLAIWSVLFGALMIPALFALFRALDGSVRRAWWATLLTMAAPLVWFSALRPLSDIPGLAATLIAQALLVRAMSRPASSGLLLAGALAAGFAIGIRSQTFTLTLPLLLLAFVMPGAVASHRARLQAIGAFAVGVLAWAVPLLVVSGGPARYLTALGQQGGEDFGGVVMFWNFPTVAVGLSALLHTFVTPWASPVLAGLVLFAAAAGIVSLVRDRRLALIVAVLAIPYAIFHLLFHETVTVRYALPLLPVVAWLAVRGADRFAASVMPAAIAGSTIWCLVHGVPAGVAYARVETPIFRAVADLSAARSDAPPAVASHRRISTESRRARMWLDEDPAAWLPAPRDVEWLELTRAWREDPGRPAWFFADPLRTDLALIDARNARVVQYRWPLDHRVFVGGARPGVFDVHMYEEPGWFLEEGWALTPETAGIAVREGWMPHLRPSIGWIRRRSGPLQMMLGGRHLGSPGDPPIQLVATIDGRTVMDREVPAGFFVDRVTLPAGSLTGEGTYARLEVTTRLAGGGAARVDLEQFDAQSDGVPMFAYDSGWNEPEYQPATGLSWRWMSGRGALWVRPVGRDVTLVISAESPLRYFDDSLTLRLSLGDEVISRLSPADDFTWTVTLPGEKLAAANGRVVIESDQSFVPGGPSGGDRRSLAIRVYRINVN